MPTPTQARTIEEIRSAAPPVDGDHGAGPLSPDDEKLLDDFATALAERTGGTAGRADAAYVRLDRVSWVYQALEVLRQNLSARDSDVRIRAVEDRFTDPLPTGYRDIRVTLLLPSGRLAALELHLASIDKVLAGANDLGKAADALDRAPVVAAQDAVTAASLRERQRALFDNAFRHGLRPEPTDEFFVTPDERSGKR